MPMLPWPHSPRPAHPGILELKAVPLEELVPFIDWRYFFLAWKIRGTYPGLLEGDSPKAEAARKLFEDGRAMLAGIVERKLLEARAVIGFFPVQRRGDSLDVFPPPCDCGACPPVASPLTRLHFLRQQIPEKPGDPLRSLADYFSPRERDWIGLFALSVGFGSSELQQSCRKAGDAYSAILAQSLGDRLTEAFAEKLHADVREKYWGYAPDPEKPFGIRPAPGYPSSPDHTEKAAIWQLLGVEHRIGMHLTDTYMMEPASSVCGYYMAHPRSVYFHVGKIGDDQIRDYASRKGWTEETARKWLLA